MTRGELEALVRTDPHLMGLPGSTTRTLHSAIVQLADERDRLLERVLDPTPYDGPSCGEDIVDRLRGIYFNAGGEHRYGSSAINREAATRILALLDARDVAERERVKQFARAEVADVRAHEAEEHCERSDNLLADARAERDAAIKRAEEAEAELRESQRARGQLMEALGSITGDCDRELDDIRAQRDRALALLREDHPDEDCTFWRAGGCGDGSCWRCRRRALLAEVADAK